MYKFNKEEEFESLLSETRNKFPDRVREIEASFGESSSPEVAVINMDD